MATNVGISIIIPHYESMCINSNAMFFGRASLGMKKATTSVAVSLARQTLSGGGESLVYTLCQNR